MSAAMVTCKKCNQSYLNDGKAHQCSKNKLTGSIDTFVTGDLVFTRYPPKHSQPIHVTLFLDSTTGLGPAYVHAGATQLEIARADTYADDKDSGGYLYAQPTNPELRARTAAVARGFAQTAKLTPYGNYPSSKDFQRLKIDVVSPHASRFTGMIRTASLAEIPFDFAALVRLLKWTLRSINSETLSANRGVTCAAFVSICHQVARMLMFFDEVGLAKGKGPEKIRACLLQVNGLVESKASLRAKLEKIGEDAERGNRPIYRDQAYRENSNRKLTADGVTVLTSQSKKIDGSIVPEEVANRVKKGAPSYEIERYWLIIQTQWLGLNEALTKSLQDILGEFFFDAKYVSSPVLSKLVLTSESWRKVVFEAY